MKNNFMSSTIVKIAAAIIASLALVYSVWTVANTLEAYNIVSANYDRFNYPNSIKIHSGVVSYDEDGNLFICKASAENAYGQRDYEYFLASDEVMTSFSWYEENDFPILSTTKKRANQSNISELLMNFLIWKDWI